MVRGFGRKHVVAFDAALFDLDDTLHDDTAVYHQAARRVAEDIAREHGIDADVLHAAYLAQAEAFWQNLAVSNLARPLGDVRQEMWLAALASVAISSAAIASRAADDYNRHRKTFLQPFPAACDLLAILRRRGCKLGLITNGFAETHREKIALLGLGDAFDAVLIADEVGMVKPDPELFRLACRKLETEPAAAVMVGDRYHRDIVGAHDAGLMTVWLDIHAEAIPRAAPRPDVTVASFDAAAQWLLAHSR